MNIETTCPLKGRRLLIAASGSIAAVKTPLLVSALIKAGAQVRCIITPSAAHLVSPLALATLSRNRCYQDVDQWNPQESKPLHIALAEWAEIVVVAPLSASSLSRWTQGLADGLLASLLLACECPVIAAPAMNTAMWENIAIKSNWQKIQQNRRVLPLPPSSGLLACDRLGDGRMVDPEIIQLAIASALIQKDQNGLLKNDWKGRSLLVTSGPTIEPLDPARVLTNRSSGRMGVILAQAARFRGAKVDLVHGPLQLPQSWLEGLSTYAVMDSIEMEKHLAILQPYADAVAMAAAIADLRKKGGANANKISKEFFLEAIENSLETVPDLLVELVSRRVKGQVLLGFAALTGDDNQIKQLGKAKRESKGCDLLMANPIDRVGQGLEEDKNGGFLLGPKGSITPIPVTTKLALSHQLLDEVLALKPNISQNN